MTKGSGEASKLLADYNGCISLYRDYEVACHDLLLKLLATEGLRVHSVTSRTKDVDSLQRKVLQEGKDYQALTDITDLVGLRVITIFADEVDRIGALIEREFSTDPDNSVDKRKALDPDRFGYLSVHYVCRFSLARGALTEYRRFGDLTCEIQVRSILQHAWAEIEHDLGYKTPAAIPVITRRQFYRLAGLLELADDEFINIRNALNSYADDVQRLIPREPETIRIDKVSLQAFLRGPSVAQRIEDELARAAGADIVESPSDMELVVEQMQYIGLRTIEELRIALEVQSSAILSLFKARLISHKHGTWNPWRGVSVFYLFQLLLARSGDAEVINRGYEKFKLRPPKRIKDGGTELLKELRDIGVLPSVE